VTKKAVAERSRPTTATTRPVGCRPAGRRDAGAAGGDVVAAEASLAGSVTLTPWEVEVWSVARA
jgi:hypothetical protein